MTGNDFADQVFDMLVKITGDPDARLKVEAIMAVHGISLDTINEAAAAGDYAKAATESAKLSRMVATHTAEDQ